MEKFLYGHLKDGVLNLYYNEKGSNFKKDEIFNWLMPENPEWNYNSKIKKVIIDKSVSEFKPKDLSSLFAGLDNLVSVEGLDFIDTSNCTCFSYLFSGCHSLRNVDLSKWDTSNVWNMNFMFVNCWKLRDVNLSGWNTEKNSGCANMFENCKSLKTIDLSTWKFNGKRASRQHGGLSGKGSGKNFSSVDKFFDSSDMFSGCNKLKEIFLPSDFVKAIHNFSVPGEILDDSDINSCVVYSDGKKFAVANNQKLHFMGSPLQSSKKWLAETMHQQTSNLGFEVYQGSRVPALSR